jgi:hypothetical protein
MCRPRISGTISEEKWKKLCCDEMPPGEAIRFDESRVVWTLPEQEKMLRLPEIRKMHYLKED